MTFAAFSFATMAAVAHELRAEVPWLLLAFVRIFITLIIAAALTRYMSIPIVIFGPRIMWIRSIVGTLGLMCTFYAVTHMPITDALAIQHTSPLWVTVILSIVYRKVPPITIGFAVFLGIGGVLLMERPAFDASTIAMAVALTGSLCTGSAQVSLRFLSGYSSTVVVAHYCAFASIVTLALCFMPITGGGMPAEVNANFLWLLPMGLFGTSGQILMTRAMAKGETQLMSLIALTIIAFAALYDYILWGTALDALKIAGLACIIAAVVVCSRTESNIPRTAHAASLNP